MVPWFKVSPERLEKPGIKLTTSGLEGEEPNHYVTEASLTCNGNVDLNIKG